jgi:hypothetical protein
LPELFGQIALLGSGETSLSGGRIFENLAQRLPSPIHIVLMETPAGFELNSAQIAWRVGEFLKKRLRNFGPIIELIPARKRGTPFGVDDPNILRPLLQADIIFMGPGSPTYAVRQLQGSLAWDLVRARHQQGVALSFASAATIAVGDYALPVYEIYKVGEDVRVEPGLGLFADFGLSLSFIPHWNNSDGGADLDTSRCFIGMDRFTQWCDLLPHGSTIVGLDEHTGLIIDFETGKCSVKGSGSVTLLRESNTEVLMAGRIFPVEVLGEVHYRELPEEGIQIAAWELIKNAEQAQVQEKLPAEVARLAEERHQARLRGDWAAADLLRHKIEAIGWKVQDTPQGQNIVRQS